MSAAADTNTATSSTDATNVASKEESKADTEKKEEESTPSSTENATATQPLRVVYDLFSFFIAFDMPSLKWTDFWRRIVSEASKAEKTNLGGKSNL